MPSLIGFFSRADGAIRFTAKPYDAPSIVISINATDIDGNGEHEIIAGTVDNSICVLTLKGQILWEKRIDGIPLMICSCDIDGNGTLDIVRPPSTGFSVCDIDEDGDLELIMPSHYMRDYILQDYLSTRTVYKSIIELLLGS